MEAGGGLARSPGPVRHRSSAQSNPTLTYPTLPYWRACAAATAARLAACRRATAARLRAEKAACAPKARMLAPPSSAAAKPP